MTMVICFGLDRFFYDQDDEPRVQALQAFVELGFTSLLREVFGTTPLLEDGRVLEVRRDGDAVVCQWLNDKEAAPILKDLRALFAKHDTYVSFSWDETDEFNIEMPTLALRRDGEVSLDKEWPIPGMQLRPHDIADFSRCWLGSGQHSNVRAAKAFLKLAEKHRLLLHSS